MWEVSVNASRQENEIKGIQIRKEEIKLSLFSDDMIIFAEDPKGQAEISLEYVIIARLQDTV